MVSAHIYGDNNNQYCVTQEKRYYTVGNENLENATTFHAVTYTYNSGEYTHATITKTIAGILDADGNATNDCVEPFDYDVCGRIISKTDGNEKTTNIAYDELGRIISEPYSAVDGQRKAKLTYYYNSSNFITTSKGSSMSPVKYFVFMYVGGDFCVV